jgi:dTDP-4-dehydrorhamnose reductase
MPPKIEVWAGLECTIARIGDHCRDQLAEACHHHSPKDLVALAELGVRTLRYPVLWERIAPKSLSDPEWDWHDLHIQRMAELGLNPILGLVHHGSGPFYTNLLDPEFPHLLARFAQLVAQRYPHITAYTPVNEPLTTARFSCLYGFWYPHKQDSDCFLRALANQCYGVALAQRAIRETNPHAKLI